MGFNVYEYVASAFFPEPFLATEEELRYGNKGSLKIDLVKGGWFSFETNDRGDAYQLAYFLDNNYSLEGYTEAKGEAVFDSLSFQSFKPVEKTPAYKVDYRPLYYQSREFTPKIHPDTQRYLKRRFIANSFVDSIRVAKVYVRYPEGDSFETIVLPFFNLDGKVKGIHRIPLLEGGLPRKVNGVSYKRSCLFDGSLKGAYMKLQGSLSNVLCISEGFEDLLSIPLLHPETKEHNFWASGGVTRIFGLDKEHLPERIDKVIVYADNDKKTGVLSDSDLRGYAKMRYHLIRQNVEVVVVTEDGYKDVNERLMSEKGVEND